MHRTYRKSDAFFQFINEIICQFQKFSIKNDFEIRPENDDFKFDRQGCQIPIK